jgi:selenium metabolism protein YedF
MRRKELRMTFLYLNSDQMGSGDSMLGKKLLKSFLSELAKSDIQIDLIGCVNGAIHLTIESSEVLPSLQALQQKGARIATCGTCLDFHNMRHRVVIGEIGTMDQTVQIMATADRVIRPS